MKYLFSFSLEHCGCPHTSYLPWREILSALPLPLTPPESLSPHWPELNTYYMSHCSAFTTILEPAAPVPSINPYILTLFHPEQKQTYLTGAPTCTFKPLSSLHHHKNVLSKDQKLLIFCHFNTMFAEICFL